MKDVEYVTDGNGRNGRSTRVEMSQMMEILEDGIGIDSSFKEESTA